jgi:hypothetical protein
MPVFGSIVRDRVSTPTTWVALSFHGQYFLQLAVETSSQEYSKLHVEEKTFIVVSVVMVDCARLTGEVVVESE